jgi:hypothetical protein
MFLSKSDDMILVKSFSNQALIVEKRTTVLLMVVLLSISVYSQKRPPFDIRRVTLTNQYELKEGKIIAEYLPIYQEIFDSLGRRHTEIEFKFKSNYPYKYRWHTFNGRLIVKSEFFENQSLQMIKEFKYKSDSLISEETIRKVTPGDTSIYIVLNYKYNKQRKPIFIEAKTGLGKKAFKSKSTYDTKGTEISRVVDCKSGFFPLDSIIKLTCIPVYDTSGRLVSNLVSTSKIGNQTIIRNYKYVYDKKSNIIGITTLNDKGVQIGRVQYIIQDNRNRISQIKFFDSNDNVTKWFALQYEIYRTKGHKLREIDY